MVFVVDNAGCSFLLLGNSIFSAVFSSAGAELFISSSVSSWGRKLSKGIARGINDRTIRWERSVPSNLEPGIHRISHIEIGKSIENTTYFILRRPGWADEVSFVELGGDASEEGEEVVEVDSLFSGNSGGGLVMGAEPVWGSC